MGRGSHRLHRYASKRSFTQDDIYRLWRVWTVQEFVLAQDVAFHLGSLDVSVDIFAGTPRSSRKWTFILGSPADRLARLPGQNATYLAGRHECASIDFDGVYLRSYIPL